MSKSEIARGLLCRRKFGTVTATLWDNGRITLTDGWRTSEGRIYEHNAIEWLSGRSQNLILWLDDWGVGTDVVRWVKERVRVLHQYLVYEVL